MVEGDVKSVSVVKNKSGIQGDYLMYTPLRKRGDKASENLARCGDDSRCQNETESLIGHKTKGGPHMDRILKLSRTRFRKSIQDKSRHFRAFPLLSALRQEP